jgi:hypothetical protein
VADHPTLALIYKTNSTVFSFAKRVAESAKGSVRSSYDSELLN